MRSTRWIAAAAAVFLTITGASVHAQQTFDISCEGQESGGGGAQRYQYTIRNVDPTGAPQTLQSFCFGTEDGVVGNYTNLVLPAGFTFTVVANDGTTCSVAFSSLRKTPHGALPLPGGAPSTYLGVFTGNVMLAPSGLPGDRVTFAFFNRRCSWDAEWFAAGPSGGGQGFPNQPVAGPTGVFTNGWIHTPGWKPVIVGPTFCDASDGSLASCPCAPGRPDSGCEIAQGTGGVTLEVLAQHTMPANRTTILGLGYPIMSTPTAIIIRAPNIDPAAPIAFGDGLRCVGSNVVRLAATFASNGCSFHTFGHGTMGGSYYYQIWFRNQPIMYCDPTAAFNLSNGKCFTW